MENNQPALSGLKREDFQKQVNGKEVDLYFLRNANGCEVAVTNYGGSLVAIMVPDRDGNMANVLGPRGASMDLWEQLGEQGQLTVQ